MFQAFRFAYGRSLLALTIGVLLASLVAQPAPAAKKKGGQGPKPGPAYHNPVLKTAFGDAYLKARLTPPQQQRLTGLVRQYYPRFVEANKILADVYTPEQQDLLARARRMAIEANVHPKNIEKRVDEARATIRLTDEQKKSMHAAKAGVSKLKAEFRKAASSFLSPAQVNTLMPGGAKKKGG